jgi:hypothetical protein
MHYGRHKTDYKLSNFMTLLEKPIHIQEVKHIFFYFDMNINHYSVSFKQAESGDGLRASDQDTKESNWIKMD